MKNKLPTERGQALILIALAAVGLFAIVGLAIDGAAKFSDQRHAQNAADTAALAGAYALTNGDSLWKLVALQRAQDNGYVSNLVTTTVTVYQCDEVDSDCGYYAGNEDYVRVLIDNHINTTFARVIGITQLHNRVHAVALAKVGGYLADGAMIISYDPSPGCSSGAGSGGGSVDISGSGIVNLTGGGIFMNSDEVCGFAIPNCADLNISGGAGINSASSVDNIDQEGCADSVPENIGQDPIAIPDDVYWPDVPAECGFASPAPTKLGVVIIDGKEVEEWLIYPGFYTDFPQASLVTNKSRIYMASGVYCIDPPMSQDVSWSPVDAVLLNGSTDPSKNKYQDPGNILPDVNPDGITLYIKAGGGFSINANNPTYMDASTSGDYQGYLIVLEGTHTSIESCSITGGADLDINGMIFAPYCNITVNGGSDSNAALNAQLIGWDLLITGNNTINFNYDPSNQVEIKSKVGLMR